MIAERGLQPRILPAVILGFIAGFFASVAVWHLATQSGIASQVAVTGGPAFLAGLIAARLSPSRLFVSWVLILVGGTVGVMTNALLAHPVVNAGERNLWPFEVALFVVFSFVPCAGGLWVGGRVSRLVSSR